MVQPAAAAAAALRLAPAEEAAEKTRSGGFLRLCVRQLLLELGDPALRLVQAQILDQHGLHQIIRHVGLLAHGLADQRVGFRVLLLARGAGTLQPGQQGRDQIAFLGSHRHLPATKTAGFR